MIVPKQGRVACFNGASTAVITNVEINPGKFTDYCRVTKPDSTLEAILRLATEKVGGVA